MKQLFLPLLLTACAPQPDDFLDLTGTWTGDCELNADIYTGTYTTTVTVDSLDEVDTFSVGRNSISGRPLEGSVEVDFTYDGSEETWGADLDGYSSEDDELYFETYDAGELWGIIIAGSATEDHVSAECLAGAWSSALHVMVWTSGSVDLDKM
jgi:hypothetical protein